MDGRPVPDAEEGPRGGNERSLPGGPQAARLDYRTARLWASPPSGGTFVWGAAIDHRRRGSRDVSGLGHGTLPAPSGLAGRDLVVAQLELALAELKRSLQR